MKDLSKYIFVFIIALITSGELNAQEEFRFGIGGNFIGNADLPDLSSYGAYSLHFGYTFIKRSGLSIGIENASSFKQIQNTNSTQTGFTTAFPFILQYNFIKPLVNMGAGPAYMSQIFKEYQNKEKANGYCIDFTGGVGLRLKQLYNNNFFPEANLRISYFKNLQHANYDIAMISLILMVRIKTE